VEQLGAKVNSMLAFKGSPAASELRLNEIVHASINIESQDIFAADVDLRQYKQPEGFTILLVVVESEEEVLSLFAALESEGEVILAPQKTFWSPCNAVAVDRFSIPWKINCLAG